jgi:SH3-like domain-containing protein
MSALLVAVSVWSASEKMSVHVRSSDLRDSPSFLGRSVAPVVYGEQVEVVGEQGNWMEVNASSGAKGWIHQSALTRKQIVFSSGGADVKTEASGEEIAVAGKGFNADVEKKFRVDHTDIDFSWVDRMEQMKIAPQELRSFLRKGGLQPQVGGAK